MSEKKVGKRLLTWVLVLVMTLSLLPLNVLADGGDSGAEPDTVTATKFCTTEPDEHGYYTITLTVRGKPVSSTESMTTPANADVVLVVDNSGSMSSSVGELCKTPKSNFTEGEPQSFIVTWTPYTCPICNAKYYKYTLGKILISDGVPEVCTGEKGRISRINAAKNVSKEFANSILSYEGNQVAVIGFSHGSEKGGADENAIKVSQELTRNPADVENAINKMEADGGTNYTAALDKAYTYLKNRSDKDGRPGYVIFISDGAPGLSGESQSDPDWNGSNQATDIKSAGYTLYTVGIALEGPAETYLKNMASDNQDEHFINVTETNYAEQLSETLKQWADKIKVTPTTKPAGTGAVLTDVINTNDFEYVEGSASSNLTVADNKTVTWVIGDIPKDTASVSFKIKARDGVYGKDIPTNENVYLTYTNANGADASMGEDQIGKPMVNIPAPQVTLTFDANGGSWEAAVENYIMGTDNKTASVTGEVGTLTLQKIGTDPVNAGHKFTGWYQDQAYTIPVLWTSPIAGAGQEGKPLYENKVLYAGWTPCQADTFSCTIQQHFVDLTGESIIPPFTATAVEAGTPIADLIAAYDSNQTWNGLTYCYDASQTTVNSNPITANQTLTENTVIDLYYYLDIWNDEDDSISGGDGIPDKYQVLVKFESANPLYGTVTGTTTQVFTGKDAEDNYVSSFDVTPDMSGITCTPTAPQYKFLKWTRDDKDVEYPGAMIKDVHGGSTIVFQAQWDTNKYTLTYDANGGTLNSSMTSPVTNIASGANVSLDYSNQPTHDKQDGKNVIFIGWTGTGTDKKVYTNGEELPDLMMQATFVNSDITVHAVWGLDDNGNGVPDALEAKVTYKVENGYWYDAATGKAAGSEIVCLRPLYKKSASGVWELCNATLGDSIPTGRAGNAGYTADSWYNGTIKTNIDAATLVTGDVTYTFKYVPETKPDTYTVVLHLDGGTYTTAPEYTKTTDGYQYCLRKATDKVNPTITTLNKNGYQFKGWSLSETAPQALIGADETFTSLSVQQNGLNGPHNEINLYAVWQEIKYTVTYNLDGGTTTSDKTIFPDLTCGVDTPTIATPTKAGYTFAGWNPEVAKTVTKDVTYKAKWNTNYVPYYPPVPPTVKIEDDDALGLNTTDHFAYIVGYGNGEVRPQNNITRAEVATIFFRLLTDDVRDENLTKTNRYSDVAATSWYNTAVSTLSSMGIITGYPDGTFRPNAAITRAEFAAIAARFDNDGDKAAAKFSDIASHWAKDEISIAYNNGWITGYPNGTFGPQRDITRAETMTLVNRVLNRQPETEDDLLPNMTVWTDNANPKAWYYLAVQEATNSHYYEFKTNSKYEKWTELRETRDWTELEK